MTSDSIEKEPSCPLVITAIDASVQLEDWLTDNRASTKKLLRENKALLFRGFRNADGLSSISSRLFDSLLNYRYRSTPRTSVGQLIYTATEYPRQLAIPQHCENSYQRTWPLTLLLHCVTPATAGGRTPLADMEAVTEAIHKDVREEFERRGVMYVRNYRAGVDLPWEEVFGTDSRGEVEAYCRENDMKFTWMDGGLRTNQVCQAMAVHPLTGTKIWFNQAHLFHVSTLDADAQRMMFSFFGKEGLPRNAYFGDGGEIDTDVLQHVRSAFEDNRIFFDWQRDDVLIIDNMQVSHGRESYEGDRDVRVCMAEPWGAQ